MADNDSDQRRGVKAAEGDSEFSQLYKRSLEIANSYPESHDELQISTMLRVGVGIECHVKKMAAVLVSPDKLDETNKEQGQLIVKQSRQLQEFLDQHPEMLVDVRELVNCRRLLIWTMMFYSMNDMSTILTSINDVSPALITLILGISQFLIMENSITDLASKTSIPSPAEVKKKLESYQSNPELLSGLLKIKQQIEKNSNN